jgi:hypothetical protein
MVLFALVLFIAMIACWFALPSTVTTESLSSTETDPLSTAVPHKVG